MLIKKYSIFVVIMLLFALTTSITSITTATLPEDKPTVYVDPPEILNLPPSSNFTISVKIFNITDFYGFGIQFRWDPNLLEYVSHNVRIPKNDYPDGVLWKSVLTVADTVHAGGWYEIAYASLYPAPSFNGSGTVFTMTFHVKGEGSCYLSFDVCDLSNKDGFAIAHNVQKGYFSNTPPPPPAKITVTPKKIVDATLIPCNNFSVNVTIQDAKDLHEFEFKLGYNTTILDCMGIVEGQFLKSVGPTSITFNEINEPEGKLHFGVILLSPSSANGSGVLATITFHVTGIGETTLHLYDVIIKNPKGELLSFDPPVDGYFNNMMITRLFVDPHELIDPTMKPSDIFQIRVNIENVMDMYDYAFKLGYDTNVITCLGAMITPPTNDTSFTVQLSINDTIGVLWVSVQYYPPALPITIYGNKTLVTVWFMVQAYGQTVLDLHDTQVSDSLGNLISHEVGDGFFATLIRDVSIEDVRVTSANKVYPGRIVTIEVVAMNRGNMTTETFNVTAYYDANPIQTQSVTLGPWSNATLTFHWNTSGLTPCHNFTISARASTVPYELKLDNNVFFDGWVKIKMIGDVNGDGIINIYDVTAVAVAYNSHEGDPAWNPECDLAPPWGIINIYDIVTVCALYQKTC